MDRTRRDAENSKKFAVQSFAKSLLDVADNLSRASAVTKESFSKIDVLGDTIGAVPVLKTLLEALALKLHYRSIIYRSEKVFRKSGIEKTDPTDEKFDPNVHNAVFQVPDSSKPLGTVSVVLKPGYMLHDRIIRPAEVGVTVVLEDKEADS
ncbi:grpE protein homolog 2, mitochondrial-like [Silene latifolia]|uniref:grpE protein homolog 2, mitochondrial-like n=1 Tax=Silene latifolia TaxID=37657 RepID=UPI003D76D5BA